MQHEQDQLAVIYELPEHSDDVPQPEQLTSNTQAELSVDNPPTEPAASIETDHAVDSQQTAQTVHNEHAERTANDQPTSSNEIPEQAEQAPGDEQVAHPNGSAQPDPGL
jgi:hypothetical protein